MKTKIEQNDQVEALNDIATGLGDLSYNVECMVGMMLCGQTNLNLAEAITQLTWTLQQIHSDKFQTKK